MLPVLGQILNFLQHVPGISVIFFASNKNQHLEHTKHVLKYLQAR